MSRFLVYFLPVPGHAFPVLEVARGLVAHGHEVVVYTGKRFESRVLGIGARYIPIPPGGDFDYDRIQERFPDLKGLTGLASLKCYIKQVFMDPIPEQVRFISPFVEQFRPEVVLTDTTVGPAKSLSMSGGMPWAVLNIVPISLSSRFTGAVCKAVHQVLHQPQFRETARRFQAECKAYPGSSLAVNLLEKLARTQAPVVRC